MKTAAGSADRNARYGFGMAARMEWIKVRSTRSSWWLIAASLLAMAAAGAGVGIGYRSHSPLATTAQIVNNSLAGAVLAQLLIGALGVLVVTSEYSTGMIRATFAAIPHRRLVLAAKATVYGAAALAVGLVASIVGFLSGQLAIGGTAIPHASLADPAMLRPVLLTGVYLGVVGLLGVGVGTIIRHTGGAIGTLFAGVFVPMIIAGMFGESGIAVGRFVPMMMLVNSIAVIKPVPGALSGWASDSVMVLYAAVALAIGGTLLARRDA
jgi:ABC-2 type transport system permease protein